MKTATIAKVEEARGKYGREVWCTFDDDRLTKCVPPENRYQVLHQAAIMKSLVGMFVTTKIGKNRGSIIQIVNIMIPTVIRYTYIQIILKVAEPLLE